MPHNPRIINVTPALAAKWLEKNNFNRKLKPAAVATLVGAIRRGEWHTGNDAVCFAPDGTVLNGQHRLHAIVESGTTVPMLIREGVAREEQLVMDQGKKRQAYEQMDIMGISGGSAKQQLCRAILLYDDDYGPTGRLEGITNTEIIALAQGDETMDTAIKLMQSLGRQVKGARVAMISLGFYLLLHAWPERVEEFHSLLCSGANLSEGSPILKLRTILLRGDIPQSNTASRKKLLALFLKAFNYWVDEKDVEVLVWRSYEDWPKPFTKASYAKLLQGRARALAGQETRRRKAAS